MSLGPLDVQRMMTDFSQLCQVILLVQEVTWYLVPGTCLSHYLVPNTNFNYPAASFWVEHSATEYIMEQYEHDQASDAFGGLTMTYKVFVIINLKLYIHDAFQILSLISETCHWQSKCTYDM